MEKSKVHFNHQDRSKKYTQKYQSFIQQLYTFFYSDILTF